MKEITSMSRVEILAIPSRTITWRLTAREIMHMATTLDAFWHYDYGAANEGRFGLHAKLKSGRHSDGFFSSKELLVHQNLLEIIAYQMVLIVRDYVRIDIDYVAGVPNSATALGAQIAKMLRATEAKMVKENENIQLITDIPARKTILLVEDVCTRGVGFLEAVAEVRRRSPEAVILQCDPVILNRGGLNVLGDYRILSLVEKRLNDWDPNECPLCPKSSIVKPKERPENWERLVLSQV